MKNIIILNGPMGCGKTTVGKKICERLHKTAFIDGDWCFDLHPFVGNNETKNMAVDNIVFMIQNYSLCSECENIVLVWLMDDKKYHDRIINEILNLKLNIIDLTLWCDEPNLVQRWTNDKICEWRNSQWLEVSKKSLNYFKSLNNVLNTSELSIDEVVDSILFMLKENGDNSIMHIKTERLLLVPLGPQFLMSTHQYASDIENTKYMIYLPNVDINETKAFLDKVHAEWQKCKPQFYEYAILLNNEHIGAVSIDIDSDNTEGELGWIINKKYWGNGYITEAARELMNFAVKELKVSKLIARCDSENIGSYRVMEKLGMTLSDRTRGRRNKLSDEDREELLYFLEIK